MRLATSSHHLFTRQHLRHILSFLHCYTFAAIKRTCAAVCTTCCFIPIVETFITLFFVTLFCVPLPCIVLFFGCILLHCCIVLKSGGLAMEGGCGFSKDRRCHVRLHGHRQLGRKEKGQTLPHCILGGQWHTRQQDMKGRDRRAGHGRPRRKVTEGGEGRHRGQRRNCLLGAVWCDGRRALDATSFAARCHSIRRARYVLATRCAVHFARALRHAGTLGRTTR